MLYHKNTIKTKQASEPPLIEDKEKDMHHLKTSKNRWTRFCQQVLCIVLCALLMAACSSSSKKPKDFSELQVWESAMDALKKRNYQIAIEKLQQLEERYPFGNFAEQAQLELIYAQFHSSDYESSELTADRFIRLHPHHRNVDYAYYMKGLSAFFNGQSEIGKFIPIDVSTRDPGPARDAFNSFTDLIERFPDSEYVLDAQYRMVHLRNHLAAYEINVAKFYMKRRAYVAAANRARFVVERFPSSPSVPDALVLMVQAYKQLDLKDYANEAKSVLINNFPQHSSVKDGSLESDKNPYAKESNWLQLITFGLLG